MSCNPFRTLLQSFGGRTNVSTFGIFNLQFSIFLFLLPTLLFSQNKTIDSLENELKQAKDEPAQIVLLNALALEYKGIDPYKTRAYGNKAYQLASKLNDKQGQANSLHRKGLSYYYLDSYDTALTYYRQSLVMSKSAGDSSLTAQAYSAIGNVYRLQGINDTALSYLEKALHIYETLHDDKNVAACLSTIGDTYLFTTEFDKALQYYERALDIAKRVNDNYRQAFCLSSMGNSYHMRGDFKRSIEYHEQAIAIAEPAGEMSIVAGSLGTIANAYSEQYNYPKAIETYLRALDIAEAKGDKHNTAFVYTGMSEIYQKQGDFKNAVKYLDKSISLSMQIGDYNRTCYALLTMAEIKTNQKDTAGARRLAEKALGMAHQYNYPNHEAWAMRIQAMIGYEEGHYAASETQLRESLRLWEEIGDQQQQAETRKYLVRTMLALGKTDEAISEGLVAMKAAKELTLPGLQLQVADLLTQAYEAKGDFKQSLYYSKLVRSFSDSLKTEENTKRQTELFLQYQFEKEKEKEQIAQQLKDDEQQARFRQQQLFIYGALIAFLLMLTLAFFIWRGYRQKQKANYVITEQKKIVEEKNREITDSINYARNIQVAMLPAEDAIAQLFPDHFVVFRPRDIVSGDFFWTGERDGLKFFAVADCTGHGVPGGFMSMLGITLLNEILAEKAITSPAAMLDELRDQIVHSLNRARKAGETLARDGMDITLCCLDTKNKQLHYAGANNPLYILRNSALTELHPDKQPVGAHETGKPFSQQTFQLAGNETIIAFSDGYPDQFGGASGKKMMYRKFKEMLAKNSTLPMNAFGKVIEDEFIRWQGTHEQVDDVCVFGVRV